MQYTSSLIILAVAVSCTHNAISICPAIWAPVCGSDGLTYPSKCFLEAARQEKKPELTLVHSGACKSKRSVDDEDQHCLEHSKHGICTLEYAPVCASNGKTYPNKCQMCAEMYNQETNLKVVHPGKCGSLDYCLPSDKGGACTDDYRPVCASDGKTYANRCDFCYNKYKKEEQGEELKMDYVGECQNCPARSKVGACERIYKPVCGSNGVTYNNDCLLCKAIFDQGKSHNNIPLVKKHDGACEEEATLYQAEFCRPEWKNGECTREFNPICGTDGKTYGNPCTFCYAVYQNQNNGKDLAVDHEGPCKIEEKGMLYTTELCRPEWKTGVCTREYDPMCGIDGVTYGNPCTFCYAKFQKQAEGSGLVLRHEGPCQPEDVLECAERSKDEVCTMEYNPVCGTDSVLYNNPCEFCYVQRKKNLQGIDLYFGHMGECYL